MGWLVFDADFTFVQEDSFLCGLAAKNGVGWGYGVKYGVRSTGRHERLG